MGKKKRGTTARNNNNRTNNHPERSDSLSSNLECEGEECGMSPKDELLQKEVVLTATAATASLSIGDIVTIKGLVNASEYNGTRGVIVSEFDVTTNRCGVRVTGKNATVMAIQITNLTLERRAKKSTIGDANFDSRRHIAIACKFCDEEERLALVKQNISTLQNCDNGLATSTIYNETKDRQLLGPRLLVSIIEKWREQATTGFIRFLNGNMTDCRAANLQFVLLRDALFHFDEWEVDWDINLTEREIDLVTQPFARHLLVNHKEYMTNCEFLHDEIEDGRDATNDQCGQSSPLPVLATEREVVSTRAVPTNDFGNNNSYNTKQVANIMKNFRKCKKDAVKIVLSTFDAGECDSFRLGLVDNGLIPVILGFLSQCEHEDFNEMVRKVKGNLRTPVDWIEILAYLGLGEQCKLDIANGIQAVVRCLCNDSKCLFFKSNKHWHDAVTPFLGLLFNLLRSSGDSSSNVTAATVSNILLQNQGFLESMVHKCFLRSYRSDIVKEHESYPQLYWIKTLESLAHKVIRDIVFVGSSFASETFSQVGFDLLKTVAKTPVVSRSYDPECKINYVIGMIRMLQNVNSHLDRGDHFATLFRLTVCVDNDAIAEVVDLGRMFTTNIDDVINITRLSYCMLLRNNSHVNVYPIDKHIAFAIKSGLLEMCFDFITRFVCDPSVRLIACDLKSDQLMEALVYIADLIQKIALHQNTSKAIRDRRSHIMQALKPLIAQVKSEQSLQFVDILVSIMDLNEGSCSRCNKPIEWRTALFCEGCRRVAYCGVKCQKKDWRCGSHSSHCSFLACSADMMGLTMFDVKTSRNISELTGLRNNIVTSQKKLFLRHKSSLFSQLLNYPDRSDCVAVFDLSNKQKSIIVHYHDQWKCSKRRKWFEDVRLPGKLICVFISQVFNDEFDEDGDINRISPNASSQCEDEEFCHWTT